MARKQSPKQQEIVGRAVHEFKHGELEASSGRRVRNPRQAIAIALHTAGASRDETSAGDRRNLARTQAKEHQAEPSRKAEGGKATAPWRSRRVGGGGETRAALYGEAAKRGIPGPSRVTKAQLARALGR